MTSPSWTEIELLGRSIRIETVPEIITKKVFYRGAHIAARDVFDIVAASVGHRQTVIEALATYPARTAIAADALRRLNPEFVMSVVDQLQIRPGFEHLKVSAIEDCLDVFSTAISFAGTKD
ncbi:hypothetical protein [Rhizobium wuzhouense]|uniref:hypothetical protein n=1 Tax=Rhizobium wuzhouense TaxID=1986026 RepID=UPI000DEEA6A4|nr:hypothetical protein [Rhizobium wuzhouense]